MAFQGLSQTLWLPRLHFDETLRVQKLVCDLILATALLIRCSDLPIRTFVTQEKLKPRVVKVGLRSVFVWLADMECSDSLKEPKGFLDLASDSPQSGEGLHSGSGLSQTSSHVDQIISAFEQITAQQPHPKPAALEGGIESSHAVRHFSQSMHAESPSLRMSSNSCLCEGCGHQTISTGLSGPSRVF